MKDRFITLIGRFIPMKIELSRYGSDYHHEQAIFPNIGQLKTKINFIRLFF
ncbi:hypothetical protein ABIE66_000951 [Peribacillus sp. B2I2]|uniref:hypothetical protein n=1 Tax=Peribacillus sp. B2I2 TaxID=3156468 RepID=UPI0035141C38